MVDEKLSDGGWDIDRWWVGYSQMMSVILSDGGWINLKKKVKLFVDTPFQGPSCKQNSTSLISSNDGQNIVDLSGWDFTAYTCTFM